VDPLISWTKYLDPVGKEIDPFISGWAEKVKSAAFILRKGDEIGKRMEVVGEEGVAIDDMVLYLKSELYDFCYLQQNAFDKEDAYCPLKRQVEIFGLIHDIFDASIHFETHDAARNFFLSLQNELKNLNYLVFHSKKYHESIGTIREQLKSKEMAGAS
jgi:V/A-type H+-transporting ATPase subunit A